MLKIHSFLKRMKGSLNDLFSVKIGRSKNIMVAMAYILSTVLVILTPDSIYDTSTGTVAKAKAVSSANAIEEETENAAIIQTTNKEDIQTQIQEIQLLQMQQDLLGDEKLQDDHQLESEELGNKEALGEEIEEEAIEAFPGSNKSNLSSNILFNQEVQEIKLQNVIEERVQEAKNEIQAKEIASKKMTDLVEKEQLLEEKKQEVEDKVQREQERIREEEARKEQERLEREEEARKEEERRKEEEARKAKEAASTYAFKVSNNDISILQRIVEAEATGEDVKGRILVANVVLNRVKSKTFPNSVEGVVFQKSQFSPISDGRYYSVSVSSTTKEAVERALKGEDYSQGALYFAARKRASSSRMNWFDSKLTYLFQHGGHEFFK